MIAAILFCASIVAFGQFGSILAVTMHQNACPTPHRSEICARHVANVTRQ